MDYSRVCYKMHHLALNRKNTVNASLSILNQQISPINTRTVGIFNKAQLDVFMDSNPDFNLDLTNQSRPLKYPEVGLWASNFLAIKQFLSSTKEYLILIEDDIKLNNRFYAKMDEYFESMPSDMECFLIFRPENIFYISGYENLQDEDQYHTSSPKIWVAHQTWSTGCIMVNRSGAQKILDYISNGISDPIDLFLFGPQSGQYFVASNSRRLNVYSPSKTEEPVAELEIYATLIQGGELIDSSN